mmetsp:Transcript_42641/g.137416  ORF Transcript_42641/g.137416 Transcript_42641/m.137416 type:complete len:297 (-) Transcript_42641:101-991(-)
MSTEAGRVPETSELDRSSVLSLGTALSRLGMVPPTLVRLRSIFVMVSCERHSVGSVPETRLARRRTSSSSFSPLHSSSGTLPERLTSSRMSSLSGAVILLGSVPEMRVFLAEISSSVGKRKHSGGSVPESFTLSSRTSFLSEPSDLWHSSPGTVPERLLERSVNFSSAGSRPSWCGMVPLNLPVVRLSFWSAVSWVSSAGSVPEKERSPSLPKSRYSSVPASGSSRAPGSVPLPPSSVPPRNLILVRVAPAFHPSFWPRGGLGEPSGCVHLTSRKAQQVELVSLKDGDLSFAPMAS